jgi:putative spermidine/putrescine transport system substrate-binding protein
MAERESWFESRRVTRREVVKGGLAAAGTLSFGPLLSACGGGNGNGNGAAPTGETGEAAEQFTGTLRVVGIGVDLIDPIREAGEAALGFSLAFDVTDGTTARQKVTTQPEAWDVYSDTTAGVDIVWASGNCAPIPRAEITHWDQYSMLYRAGRVDPEDENCTVGQGDAPFRKQYTTEDGGEPMSWADSETGELPDEDEPEYLTFVGHVFNVDAIGYNSEVIQKEPTEVSWAELFNSEHRGRVALLNDANIGLQDAAIAAEVLGMMQFGDKGDMTRDEIDGLIKILTDLKRQNHFRAFWSTFDESVNLMSAGEVVVESMWSPAVSLLQAQGHPTRYAAPPEGFRGWFGGHFLAKHLQQDDAKWRAAIDYVNWWHSGEPAAIMMRQGYYNVVQETSQEHVDPGEWEFWIEGNPAPEVLDSPFGEQSIKEGQVRDGGSFRDRVCKYLSWNSIMEERQYQVQRWNEFLAA